MEERIQILEQRIDYLEKQVDFCLKALKDRTLIISESNSDEEA